MKLKLLIASLFIAVHGYSQNMDSLLTSFYFNDGAISSDTNGFDFNVVYNTSPTYWAIDSFPESVVFNAELSYDNPLDSNQSYQIRIGKGGQLYSFRSAFGESVPPQWRSSNWVQPSYGGGTSYAPWVDEVWQMVCVDESLNNTPDSSYFIHQAGVYLKTPAQNKPFFSPKIAEYYDHQNQSYSIVNWGQQAHTDDLLNINHTSNLLYYTKYTNKGKGVIQVDNMIYNFGQDNISFLNMPWGGVRNSSLDHFFISTPINDYNLTTGLYGQTPIVQTANTGGWVAWANDTNGNSSALGMAHPITTNTYGNKFRYGDAGNLNATWNERDYHVFEMVKQPFPGQLGFGKSMSFRYFYVLGANVDSVKNKILNENLVYNSLDTAYIPSAVNVDSVRYLFQQTGTSITESISNTNSGLLLRTSPYLNSYPLFKITSVTNEDVISSNPYFFSTVAYDGSAIAMELLGFLDNPSIISVLHDTICKNESYLFPDGSALSNISSDTIHHSLLASTQGGWDSLVITNLEVTDINVGVNQVGINLTSEETIGSYQWLDCNDFNSPIVGETNQNYVPISNGSFAVEVTKGNCTDTSNCYTISNLNIIENNFGTDLQVYPNPTDGKILIDLCDAYATVSISISDIKGKLIRSEKYVQEQVISLSIQEPNGFYLLTILAEDKTAIIRLIKK